MELDLAENTNTKTSLLRITAETTAGFEENVRLLGRGETELALFGGMQTYQGLRGIGPYAGEPPYKDIRGITVAYAGYISRNARQGISKVTVLVGKRSVLVPWKVDGIFWRSGRDLFTWYHLYS